MYFEVGDRIKLKKAHPCGSHEWDVLRVGIDFRLRCVGCGHGIMTPRTLVEKNCRGVCHAGETQYHRPEAKKPETPEGAKAPGKPLPGQEASDD